MRQIARIAVVAVAALLAACGGVGSEKNKMEETLYLYAGAVRWGEV